MSHSQTRVREQTRNVAPERKSAGRSSKGDWPELRVRKLPATSQKMTALLSQCPREAVTKRRTLGVPKQRSRKLEAWNDRLGRPCAPADWGSPCSSLPKPALAVCWQPLAFCTLQLHHSVLCHGHRMPPLHMSLCLHMVLFLSEQQSGYSGDENLSPGDSITIVTS